MELLKIKEHIEKYIEELGKFREQIIDAGERKAQAQANYEKELAIVIIGLKNGKEYKLDNETIIHPPVSSTDKIAKGICWRESLYAMETENFYKSLIVNIDCIQSQLNAMQSLNKHFE